MTEISVNQELGTVVLGREKIAPLADIIAAAMAEMLGMEQSFFGRFFMRRAIGAPRRTRRSPCSPSASAPASTAWSPARRR